MNQLFRFQLFAICLTVCLLIGCNVRRPSYIIPEADMEGLLYDYHMAQSLGEELPYSEHYKKNLYTKAVFEKHGITEAHFDTSLVWYTRNTKVLSDIYERVSDRLREKRDHINHLIAVRDNRPDTSTPGDSIDIWIGERMSLLAGGMPLSNKVAFTIPSDTNFKKRDTLLWEVRYRFLEGIPDSIQAPIMAMQIVYENDSMISQTKKIFQTGVEQLVLQSDTLGMIKEVNGFIFYPPTTGRRTLLMDQISLTRYHSTDTLAVVGKDSISADSLESKQADAVIIPSNKKLEKKETLRRLNPGELNKRSDEGVPVKPKQLQQKQEIKKENRQRLRRSSRELTKPISIQQHN